MDKFIKKRFLKSGKISIHDLDDPEAIQGRVREAAELIGVHGMGSKSHIECVAGRVLRRSHIPFGPDDPGLEANDEAVRCLGYRLMGFELFFEEEVYLLYLDSQLDTVGQYRRIEVREGRVVEVCRSGMIEEGDLVGRIHSSTTPAHGLSRVLGARFEWFARIGDQSLFGFGPHCFDSVSGQVGPAGRMLLDVEQLLDGGGQKVPILMGRLVES